MACNRLDARTRGRLVDAGLIARAESLEGNVGRDLHSSHPRERSKLTKDQHSAKVIGIADETAESLSPVRANTAVLTIRNFTCSHLMNGGVPQT
jgi:hypothetical protein